MSEYDAATYERFSSAVQRQVHALRVILDNLQVTFLCGQKEELGKIWTYTKTAGESCLSTNQPARASGFKVDTHSCELSPVTFLAKFFKGKALTSPFSSCPGSSNFTSDPPRQTVTS